MHIDDQVNGYKNTSKPQKGASFQLWSSGRRKEQAFDFGTADRRGAGRRLLLSLPSLSWILALTLAIVSLLSTSSVTVFPVSVFTKICISAGGLLGLASSRSPSPAAGVGFCVVGGGGGCGVER